MKKGFPTLLLIVSLLFAHLLLFSKPLSPRLGIKPIFFSESSGETVSVITDDGGHTGREAIYPFISENHRGFFLRDGAIISSLPKQQVLASSRLGYASWLGAGETSSQGFFSPNQVLQGILPGGGLPYLTDYGLYHFSLDRRRIKELAPDGAELWSYGLNAIISAFVDTSEYRLIGTVQGEVILLDKKGDVMYRFEPAFGGIKAIYGLAIDSSGRRIAILHGVEPQKLSLYEKMDKKWQIFSELELPGHLFRETSLDFLHGGKVISVERNGYILTIDILSSEMKRCEIPAYYLGGGTFSSLSISYGVNESEEKALMLLDETGEYLLSLDTEEKPWFFKQDGDRLFLGLDDAIGGMDIERF